MKISELFEDGSQSILLDILKNLLDKGKIVYLNAESSARGGRNFGKLRDIRTGRILQVRHDAIVYDHRRDREPTDRTISNSFFLMHQPIDEHYTIKKISGGPEAFELVDA